MTAAINAENPTLKRRVEILKSLEEKNHIPIVMLSKLFNVSDVTIRNDLSQLEHKGLLIRTRGGALKQQRAGIDFRLNEKASLHFQEKQKIGKKATEFIKDGDTIILDSGTTTEQLAKNLSHFKELTVITNAINIAGQLADYPNVRVIIPGGCMRDNSVSLVGSSAEKSLKNFYCDKVFMGVDGIQSGYGISTPNMEEAQLNRIMIEVSSELIVIADSSKFFKKSFAFISPISDITTLITDKNIDKQELENLKSANVNVVLA